VSFSPLKPAKSIFCGLKALYTKLLQFTRSVVIGLHAENLYVANQLMIAWKEISVNLGKEGEDRGRKHFF